MNRADRLFWGWVIFVFLLLGGPATAATLDDLELGNLLLGEKWKRAFLKDRTVVVAFWSFRDEACMKGIPRLKKIQEEYRSRGLVLMGIHNGRVLQERLLALCVARKVNYSVYEGGKIAGMEVKEEAEDLLGRLDRYVEHQMQRSEHFVNTGYPFKARAIWKKLAKDFKGDGIAEKAGGVLKGKGEDQKFQMELLAAEALKEIETIADPIPAVEKEEDLDAWAVKHGRTLKRIRELAKEWKKTFEDTKVHERLK
ncbi:MAG: hypothetical protein ACYTHM_17565 [Planctomycetota bacterium]|jgi:thiol-disulfide isomerase/thioredoxin